MMNNPIKLNQRRWAAQLALTTGLTLLFIAVLLWSFGGAVPALADPGTLYVDGATGSDTTNCTSPAAPCETIGYALTQAGNGDEIRVAAGTYTETLDVAGNPITLRGGYTVSGTVWLPRTGETVVDADGADSPVFSIGPGNNVTVESFTVQGANHVSSQGGGIRVDRATAVVSGTVVRNNAALLGGGIWVEKWEGYPGSLLLINSSLLTNTASQGGGGLSSSGWPTVTLDNVEVRGNTAQNGGGGLNVEQVTITNSVIVSNTAGGSGGGILANVAYIYNSEISDNEANGAGTVYGGGISVGASGPGGHLVIQDSTVSNNRVVGTESIGGGIDAEWSEAIIARTIISGNSATAHGGVSLWHTVLTMTNSLVVSNTDVGIGGDPVTGTIMHLTAADNESNGARVGGAIEIVNSVLWGNGGTDYVCWGGCTLDYSDVGTGDTTGVDNISADPLFVDPANGDYHLQPDSPCVDTGTNTGAPDHDFEGDARPFAYGVDMGADEWWPMLSVTLSTDRAGEGPPSTDVTYVFTVTNNGDYTDTFSLEVSGVWTPTLDVGITSPLASGGSSAVVLTVTIPPDAVNGASDVATLAATSGWSTAVSDSALATTTARWHKVYLPITLRNFGP